MNLLKDLQEEYKLTYLFISHDLSVVKFIADRVCVMFLGSVCEVGETKELYDHPLHPYTRFLMNAIPKADPHLRTKEKELLSGEIPSPVNPPSGCNSTQDVLMHRKFVEKNSRHVRLLGIERCFVISRWGKSIKSTGGP